MLCIVSMDLKKLVQATFTLCSNVFKIIVILEVQLLVSFLNLGKGESNVNDDSGFEILLNFDAAIVAE